MIIVIGVLLVAGWLLGLDFYRTSTSVGLMAGYAAGACVMAVASKMKKRQSEGEISSQGT